MHKLISLAVSRGSTATTLPGARRYLLSHLPSPIPGLQLTPWSGRRAEPAYTDRHSSHNHLRRLARQEFYKQASLARSHARAARICAALGLSTRDRAHAMPATRTLSREEARILRIVAGTHKSCQIKITQSDYPPRKEGHGCRKSRWDYTPSTLTVAVGAEWIDTMLQHLYIRAEGEVCDRRAIKLHGITARRYWLRQASGRRGWLVTAPRRDPYHAAVDESAAAVKFAVQAWRAQDESARKRAAENAQLAHIWVTEQDSLAAGNCGPITIAMAAKIKSTLGGDIYAVRADVLLGMRDDSYVRRAISIAAQRAH